MAVSLGHIYCLPCTDIRTTSQLRQQTIGIAQNSFPSYDCFVLPEPSAQYSQYVSRSSILLSSTHRDDYQNYPANFALESLRARGGSWGAILVQNLLWTVRYSPAPPEAVFSFWRLQISCSRCCLYQHRLSWEHRCRRPMEDIRSPRAAIWIYSAFYMWNARFLRVVFVGLWSGSISLGMITH